MTQGQSGSARRSLVRRAYRCAALVAVIALAVAAPGVATAQAKEPSRDSCKLVIVNKDGTTTEKDVPEGTKIGSYVCFGGQWLRTVLARTGYTDVVTLAPDGSVSINDFTFDNATDMSMVEYTDVLQALLGVKSEPVDRVVVATDNGASLTDEQIDQLLEGRDAGDVRVLKVFDQPEESATFADLGDQVGADQPVQVLARKKSWWSRAWKWVKSHCTLIPPKCVIKW